MSTQGWSREKVIAQVLTPLDKSALLATAAADPNSIMCYWLPASIMKDGVAVNGGTDIDTLDAQFAASVYPKFADWQLLDNNPATGAIAADGVGAVPGTQERPDLEVHRHAPDRMAGTGQQPRHEEDCRCQRQPLPTAQQRPHLEVRRAADDGMAGDRQQPGDGRHRRERRRSLSVAQQRPHLEVHGRPTYRLAGTRQQSGDEAHRGSGGKLYQLHNNGRIWKYVSPPMTGWRELDNNPATVSILAADNDLYPDARQRPHLEVHRRSAHGLAGAGQQSEDETDRRRRRAPVSDPQWRGHLEVRRAAVDRVAADRR